MATNPFKIPGLTGLPRLPSLTVSEDDTESFDEKAFKRFFRGNPEAKLDVVQKYQDRSMAESALQVIENFGLEAKDIITGIPILGAQLAKKAISAAFNPTDTLEAITSGEAWEDLKDVAAEVGSNIKEDYVKRWGPLFEGDFEEFGRRTAERPLSFLLDLGGAASLAGGAAKALGRGLAREAGTQALEKTGTVLPQFNGLIQPLAQGANLTEKTGIALQNVGRALDPLAVGKAGIGAIGQKFPELPVIGAKASYARMARKLGMNITIEEAERLRPGLVKEIEDFDTITNQMSAEELQKLPVHLSGLDTVPLSEQSEFFKQASQQARALFGNPKNISAFGLTDELAKRRVAFPLVQKYVREGKLQLPDELLADLEARKLITRDIDGKINLRAEGGVENLPSQLFDDNTLLPIQDAVSKASYVPLLDAEQKLQPYTFFGRITRGLDRPKSPFEKTFAGDMSLKYLKTKDPSVIADIRETARMFATERANAELVQNISERLLKAVDPVTGEKLVKPLYMGKVPNNIREFANGADAARALNALEKPLKVKSIDDVYSHVFGKKQSEYLGLLQKQNRGLSRSELVDLANKDIADTLQREGFDGFFARSSGDFLIADEARHPFSKLQDGHIAFAPKQMMRQAIMQKKLSEGVISGLDAGHTLEGATQRAMVGLFPEKEELYQLATKDLTERSKRGLEIVNDTLLDKDGFQKFRSEFKGNLKGALKDLDLDEKEIQRLIKSQETDASRSFRKMSGESVAGMNWAYQIPKASADRILEIVRPNTNVNAFIKHFWDQPLQLWRGAVLNLTPRWHVNNFFGNMMLNVLSGTLNPMDYMRAGKLFALRMADRFPRAIGTPLAAVKKLSGMTDDEFNKLRELGNIIPPEIAMGTFARAENQALSLPQAALTPTAKIQSWITNNRFTRVLSNTARASADVNSLTDQFFRDAQFFKLVRGQIRKESKGAINKVLKSFSVADDAVFDFVKRMNSETATQMADKIGEFLPNYLKLLTPVERKYVRRIAPFYSWYKHIVGTALMLPLNHPKRSAFIGAIGRLGDDLNAQELKENGLDPQDVKLVARWLKGTTVVGKGGAGPKFLSLRAINPFSTIAEIGNLGTALDPRLQIALERMTGIDLFTQRPLQKEVVVGPDGIPREQLSNSILDDVIGAVPQAELARRLINPTVEDLNGQVVFRRDRMAEMFKLLGVNINEQDIEKIKDRAQRKRGELAGKALNQLLGKKKKDPEALRQLLDAINQ